MFENCTSLAGVTLPNGLLSTGDYTFSGCASLTNIIIPNSVTNIGFSAFFRCTSLTCLTLPDSVAFIESGAFGGCAHLSQVTILGDLTLIGEGAFAGCTDLTGFFCAGNAPGLVGTFVFDGTPNVTLYYLPGVTGWDTTFPGIPTALWLPQAQTTSANFGGQTNQFGFNIAWASGQTVVVEACTNLFNSVWQPVWTNTLTGDSAGFTDPQWTNFSSRFYRVRSQ